MPDFDLTAQGFRLSPVFHKSTKNLKNSRNTFESGPEDANVIRYLFPWELPCP